MLFFCCCLLRTWANRRGADVSQQSVVAALLLVYSNFRNESYIGKVLGYSWGQNRIESMVRV
jgi:hypothetical protein